MYDLGQIKKVDVKSVWRYEALNFTPWLAENLDKLSDLIGMDLELAGREAEVGDFSLDLLAKDVSTNRNVVIENQFNPTNHKHLGQLITYASYATQGQLRVEGWDDRITPTVSTPLNCRSNPITQ